MLALQAYSKQFNNGDTSAAAANANANANASAAADFTSIKTYLQVLHRSIKGQLEQVDKAESMLNTKGQLSRLGNEYGNYKAEAVSLESSIATKSSSVQQLTDSLVVVDERLGEVLESLEEKHGQSGNGSGTSQATKIGRLSE